MPPTSRTISETETIYTSRDDAFRMTVALRSRQRSGLWTIQVPRPIWLSASMTFRELKADFAGRFTQDPNQIRIAVHWARVEREVENPAIEPTVLDEHGCSDLLRTLKDRLGLD